MERRLRILSVLQRLHFGGHENRLLSLGRTIDRDRFDYSVAVLTDASTASVGGLMRDEFLDAGIELIELKLPGQQAACRPFHLRKLPGAALFGWRAVGELVRLIRRRGIDVVDTHHTIAKLAAVAAARITGTRSVVTEYHQPFSMRLASQFALGASDAIVTDSRCRAAEIQDWMIRSKPSVSVIHNGVDPPAATRPADEVRRILQIPDRPGAPVIGQISALIPIKGHRLLLDAAAIVLKQRPECMFLFVGYDRGYSQYAEELKDHAAQLGIAENVRFTGYAGPIGDVWQLIDIHAHASLFDSLPNAIIEGMSLAKPAVVTSVGGIPEVVDHETTGLVVPPNDSEALAGGLLRLLGDDRFAHRLGTAAQMRYRERLRPEVMARALEALFRDVVRPRTRFGWRSRPHIFRTAESRRGRSVTDTVNSKP